MERPTGIQLVAADHPSLGDDIDGFLERLEREQRWFGPSGRAGTKPFRSLVEALRSRGGFRMAAVECGRIVGLARVDAAGELFLAVAAEHRGHGVGTALGRAMAVRARDLHHARLVIRTTRRGLAVRRIGEQLGAICVELGRGRAELILDLERLERTA